jgi:chemotaxis methyl-accepting protein methylase
MNNVRREVGRHFRNKKREYLKSKINELATNSKNKNIRDMYRGINGFKILYQLRNSVVKDENGDPDLTIASRSFENVSQFNLRTIIINQNLIHEKNEEEVEFWQCLLPFGPEHSAFSSAVKKLTN